MAYSKISYIGDGSTTSYTTPSYIEKSHIAVWVDGNLSFEHSWTGPNTITFNTAPASGAVIEIVRNSSQQTRLVNYQQPSPLDAETLNRDSKQAFYMAQEALDEASLALHRTPDGDSYDAEGNPIVNVGSPTNGADAATKSYVDIAVATGVPGGPITLFTVADYTELRGLTTAAYAANRVFVTDPAPGEFWHDASDTTSADDGGFIIVDASGRRWKRLEGFAGYVCPTWWGAKPNGTPGWSEEANTTAIQACINAYTAVNKIIHKILFTRKGTYSVNDTIRISGSSSLGGFKFTIDLGTCTLSQSTDNIPLIEIYGGVDYLWRIENGMLQFSVDQPIGNTKAICLAFSDNPDDGVSSNGPHNGVISRMRFRRCCTGIGILDKPTDIAFTIWDVRIEYCFFEGYSRHAIDIHPTPSGSTGAKNITIRSCYINDDFKSPGSTPILKFSNVRVLNIDDLEVIRVARPVLSAEYAYFDIRALSIENPGGTTIGDACPYLLSFFASRGIINSITFDGLDYQGTSSRYMPLLRASGFSANSSSKITVSRIELWRLESISGKFCVFGGDTYGGFTLTSPPFYSNTSVSTCPLFNYDPTNSSDIDVAINSSLTYYVNTYKSINIADGNASTTVSPSATNVVLTGTPTGNRTITVNPADFAPNMLSSPDIGPGAFVTIRLVTATANAVTINWGADSYTFPANKRGTITLVWSSPNNWNVADLTLFD